MTMSGKPELRERLLHVIDRFPSRSVLVVGDLIADEFLYGRISRVSREAPVLVLQYRDLVRMPGGAANAANNIIELGARAAIIGSVGDDEAGIDLVETLKKKGAQVDRVSVSKSHTTPLLTRILAGAHHSAPQQVVRVDRIGRTSSGQREMPSFPSDFLADYEAVILSDYGYGYVTPGLFRQIRSLTRKLNLALLVDSRFRIADFPGVTSMTPNITELEAASGTEIGNDAKLLQKIGRGFMRKMGLPYLLVTQGRFGMTLVRPRRPSLHIPIFGTDEVADVTGAGDTVIAAFTLALASGATPEEAARLANYAAGIVVMKRGTAAVSGEELRCAIEGDLSQ
jgi:rfaE bifunctional protein kinase chain/domain